MLTTDFIYDDRRLSDFNGIMCRFGDGGDETISNGSNIEFTSINPSASPFWNHYATKYSEPISATIQICKFNCSDINNHVFSPAEISEIMRWLNREDGYHKFKLIGEDINWFYMAQINVSQILVGGQCVGFELTITTDKPFAYVEQNDLEFEVEDIDTNFIIEDTSDRIGYVYPDMEITVLEAGDLMIVNSQDPSRPFSVSGCEEGEVITVDGRHMLCTASSTSTVGLEKRFNFRFLKIMNTYTDRENIYSSNLKIKIKFKWNPIKKITIS